MKTLKLAVFGTVMALVIWFGLGSQSVMAASYGHSGGPRAYIVQSAPRPHVVYQPQHQSYRGGYGGYGAYREVTPDGYWMDQYTTVQTPYGPQTYRRQVWVARRLDPIIPQVPIRFGFRINLFGH